jgi:phthiocerol/phenolphthiocerol synthesis type-I polyketide synthase E
MSRGTEIAVVGLAGEFPRAESVDELWLQVQEGAECLTFFSDEELRAAGVDRERLASPDYVPARGILRGAEGFDAGLFGMASSEAVLMDPQQRRFLQVAWAALENTGYCTPAGLRVGVFAGAGTNTHLWRLGVPLDPDSAEAWQATLWNDNDFLATRVSYKLNLRGPAATVQTACSTSLVSVIMAAQNLLAGDCDLAIAGGAALKTPQVRGYVYTKGGILSPDGHCRPFDLRSAGTVPANGVAAVVLKRLDDAIADRDTIHAVLTGYGLNNDGSDKVSYNAPSAAGQAAAILEAQRTAEIDPSDIGYIEAHGTGTALGDAIEISALSRVFAKSSRRVRLGSVKSNVGHLDIASGITGLIKACLTVRDGLLTPTVHFEQSNPELRLDESPFAVCDRLEPWQTSERRMAGVSSFGIGGTNAHVIVEEPPRRATTPASGQPEIIMLSGRTAEAVTRQRNRLAAHLTAHADVAIEDVAFTLAEGRQPMGVRQAIVATDREDLLDRLADAGKPTEAEAAPAIVFMYPGGGTLRAGMAAALYRSSPVFAGHLDECVGCFNVQGRSAIRRLLLDDSPQEPRFATTLEAIFAFEYALTACLRRQGIEPSAMIGHSLGEYAAAVTAGVFTLAEAALAVEARSAVLEEAGGAMLSVALPAADVRAEIPARLSIAAINTAELTVVSGHAEDIAAYRQLLGDRGVEVRDVAIAAAAHSALLEPGLAAFRSRLNGLRPVPASIPLVSGLTGTWAPPELPADIDYWVHQLREPVEFASGIDAVLSMAPTPILVEVGPGRALSSLAARRAGSRSRIVTMCPADTPGDISFAQAMARLWELGTAVRQPEALAAARGRVPLPTYSFEERQFLPAVTPGAQAPGARTPDRWFHAASWQTSVRPVIDVAGTRRILVAGTNAAAVDELRTLLPQCEIRLSETVDAAWSPDEVVIDVVADPSGTHLDQEIDRAERLLRLARELDRVAAGPVRFLLIGTGLHDIDGTEAVCPDRRQLLGLCLSLSQELDWFEWTAVDLRHDRAAADWPTVVAAEISAHTPEREVAYRRGRRLVQSFTELTMPPMGDGSPFGAGKVYLITGGTGQVGNVIVEHLVERIGACVVVLTRSRRAAPSWSDSPMVHVVTGDVADECDVRKAIAQAEERFGRLDGVIHLAGVLNGRSVPRQAIRMERSDLVEQLRPKARGAAALAAALTDRRLDFVVLFSSNAAVLGGLGLGAYAAANAVLDGFSAAQLRLGPTRWLTLAWDGWGGKGTATGAEQSTSLDVFALTPTEAIGALERALCAHGLDRIVVSKGDLTVRRRVWVTERGRSAPTAVAEDEPLAEVLATDVDPTVNRLVRLWGEVLGSACGPHTNFFESGGHSLLALRLLRRIEESLGRSLPANAIAHAPTPKRLAPLLAEPGSVDIVELAAHAGPPLLLVHPQGGGVLCYTALAQGLGVRVLACDDHRLAVADPPRESVELLAARYLEALRREAPTGPYRVGGWSFGGVVAFEVARMLCAAGEKVQLVMIDSPAPNGQRLPQSGAEELAATIVWNWLRQAGVQPTASYGEFLALSREERERAAADAATAAGMPSLVHAMANAGGNDLLRRTVAVGAWHSIELDAYRPEPCDLDALVLRAALQDNGPLAGLESNSRDLGWRSLIPSVTVVDVEGDHASVLAQPRVREVTAAIRRWLRS